MNMLKNNLDTLHELYMAHMPSMYGLTNEGNYLVYNGDKVDISHFDINCLNAPGNPFRSSLDSLSPDDVFRIIKLHSFSTDIEMRAAKLASVPKDSPEAKKLYEEQKQQQAIMSVEEFYGAVNSSNPMDEKTRTEVNAFYRFVGDLIVYEDFLTEGSRNLLSRYRNYVLSLQLRDEEELNQNQIEARDNLAKFTRERQEKKYGKKDQQLEKGRAYTLRKNAAFVAHAEIIMLILAMALVLTAIAIYVIN